MKNTLNTYLKKLISLLEINIDILIFTAILTDPVEKSIKNMIVTTNEFDIGEAFYFLLGTRAYIKRKLFRLVFKD